MGFGSIGGIVWPRRTSRAGVGSCLGELEQIDGSEHAWFEERGEVCTLLALADDATSRLMQLRFVASESAFDFFRPTRAYLEAHGKPVAFYPANPCYAAIRKASKNRQRYVGEKQNGQIAFNRGESG